MAGVPQPMYQGAQGVSSAAPLPERSAASFGAGIGDAISGAGAELEQTSLNAVRVERERQRQSENAQAAIAAANLHTGLNQARLDLRDQAPDDGSGHVTNVAATADQQINDFLGTIKDPRVREQWAATTASMKAGMVDDEEAWARARRITSIGTNASEAQRNWYNSLQNAPTPEAFQSSIEAGQTFWKNAQVDPATREKGIREWSSGAAENFALGMIQSDPVKAKALLQGGLDTWIDPDKKAALLGKADTQIRILETDQRRQADVLKSQTVTDAEGMGQKIDQGVLLPEDQVTVTVAKLKAFGLDNRAEELAYKEGKLKLSRISDHWTPTDWDNAINPLAAKVAQGKASDDEQRELKILQELHGPKVAAFKNDPDGKSAASGITPPQVDLAAPDQGSVQARKSWAVSYARSGGLVEPPYLTKDQLDQYRGKAAQGPVSQLEVAHEIRETWGMDAAPSIVRQLGGDSKADMQIMLGLNDRMAQVYKHGTDALAKNSVQLKDDVSRQVFATYANAIPPDMRPALYDAARKITAGWMLEQGRTGPTADYADVFSKAIHRAGGMLGSWGENSATGGFVNWNGRFAWMPNDMGRTDFQQRISRARPADWTAAAVDPTGNPTTSAPFHLGHDGKPVAYSADEISRFGRGSLQTVAPGIFHLVDPAGGVVVDGRGQPWQFDVRRLPRSHFGAH